MTRREEIIQVTKQKEKEIGFTQIVKEAKGVNSAYGIGFLEGAEWADETMIEKAWDWIEDNVLSINQQDMSRLYFEQFKKYMKGE